MPPKSGTRRCRGYCFTYWPGHRQGKTEDEICLLLKNVTCQYIVFQLETGKQPDQDLNGDHIQGYVYFKNTTTIAQAVGRLPGAPHIEYQRAPKNSDAINYCKKNETRRPGTTFFEYGDMPADTGVTNSSLLDTIKYAQQHGMKATMDEDEHLCGIARHTKGIQTLANHSANKRIPMIRDVMIYYLWGDSGAGKTTWASTRFKPEDTYVVSDRKDTWFDNYQGEKCVVLDEFEGKTDWGLVKRILDGSKMLLPTKGSHVYGEYHTVIVTANCDPRTFYDQSKNFWTAQAPWGPLQRRLYKGGIYKATGAWGMEQPPSWQPPLPPIGDTEWQRQTEMDDILTSLLDEELPMEDILPRQQQQDAESEEDPLAFFAGLNEPDAYNDVQQDLDGGIPAPDAFADGWNTDWSTF